MNHIALPGPTAGVGPLGAILRDVNPTAGAYLPEPHDAEFSCRYDMHDDGGRRLQESQGKRLAEHLTRNWIVLPTRPGIVG